MNARRVVCLAIAAALVSGSTIFAYDWQNRDAGSKIRGDYRNGPMSTSPNIVRWMPARQNAVTAPAPQIVRNNAPAPQAAPRQNVAPQPNAMAEANPNPSRSVRTFSVESRGSASMSAAPARVYYNAPAPSRGLNLRADRKITGYHGYGL